MRQLQTLLLHLLAGCACGTGLTDLCAPAILTWYNMPGGGDALCNCDKVVRATAHSIIQAQLIGAAIGGVLFVAAGLLLRRRGGRPAAPA